MTVWEQQDDKEDDKLEMKMTPITASFSQCKRVKTLFDLSAQREL